MAGEFKDRNGCNENCCHLETAVQKLRGSSGDSEELSSFTIANSKSYILSWFLGENFAQEPFFVYPAVDIH